MPEEIGDEGAGFVPAPHANGVTDSDSVDDIEARLNDSIERLPEPQREVMRTVLQFEARSHKGPLPPASELVAYDQALPGLAREIVDNAKAEQTHRHLMDQSTGRQEYILNIAGLAAVLIALAMMLGIVAYMVALGSPGAAATLGAGIIVGVVVALTNYNKGSVQPASTPELPKKPGE